MGHSSDAVCSHRPTGTSEEWAARYEELELAARVATRRAAAAEAELHRMKQQLEATDKRAKELAWQVRCPEALFSPLLGGLSAHS